MFENFEIGDTIIVINKYNHIDYYAVEGKGKKCIYNRENKSFSKETYNFIAVRELEDEYAYTYFVEYGYDIEGYKYYNLNKDLDEIKEEYTKILNEKYSKQLEDFKDKKNKELKNDVASFEKKLKNLKCTKRR